MSSFPWNSCFARLNYSRLPVVSLDVMISERENKREALFHFSFESFSFVHLKINYITILFVISNFVAD